MQWLSEHSDLLNSIGTLGMLAVWIVYANMLYLSLRRQRRPRILIAMRSSDGGGPDDDVCVITSLTSETIYLEHVIGVVISEQGESTGLVSRRGSLSNDDREDARTRPVEQGPMAPGEVLVAGTIREIAACAAHRGIDDGGVGVATIQALEIRVVATMSSEDQPIGAWKRFGVDRVDDGYVVSAERLGTKQMHSRRERRQVRRWLDDVKDVGLTA